jgi:hypothetical protein
MCADDDVSLIHVLNEFSQQFFFCLFQQWSAAYFDKMLDLMMNMSYIQDSMTELLVYKPIRPFRNGTVFEMVTGLLKSYLPQSYIK